MDYKEPMEKPNWWLTFWYLMGVVAVVGWIVAVLGKAESRSLIMAGTMWIVSGVNVARLEILDAIKSERQR